MPRLVTIILCCSLTCGFFAFADDEPQSHANSCPRNCKKCEFIVKQSLDWLASKQTPDGYWIAGGPAAFLTTAAKTEKTDEVHGTASKYLGMWVTTSGAILAFYANGSDLNQGPYRGNLRKAVDYLMNHAKKAQERKAFPLMNWDVAFISLAVAETYAHHPDDKYKEMLVWLADLMDKNQEKPTRAYGPGGWTHSSRRYGNLGATNNRYGAFVAPTIWNVAALGIIRDLGIPINEDALKKGAYYLLCASAKKGGTMYYGIMPNVPLGTPPEPGRTAGALWALDRAGVTGDPVQKRMTDYLASNLKPLYKGHGAVIFHYLNGALATKLLGEPLRSQYWKLFRDKMLQEFTADGFFQNRWLKGETIWWYELSMGNNWSSAAFPLIFQLDSPHLKTWFMRAKPLRVESPITLVSEKWLKGYPKPAPQQGTSSSQPAKKPDKDTPQAPDPDKLESLNKEAVPRPAVPTPQPILQTDIGNLGAVLQEVDDTAARQLNLPSGGMMIIAVGEEGSLATANLEAGDIITQVNGQTVKTAEELKTAMISAKTGDTVTLTVIHKRKSITVTIQIVNRP